MTDYIETQTKDGAKVRIEVEFASKPSTGFAHKSTAESSPEEQAAQTYEQTLATIRLWANGVLETLVGLDTVPSSASVDFSIKVDSENGAMVAKTRDEGQFRVSLTWKQPESTEAEAAKE